MNKYSKWFVMMTAVLLMLSSFVLVSNAGNGFVEKADKIKDTDESEELLEINLGDLYGDLYVLNRSDNGEPIFELITNYTTNESALCHIPLDPDGELIHMLVIEGECELPEDALVVEVHFGRLSMARSPDKVLENGFDEVIMAMNEAIVIDRDASGRILLTKEAENETGVTYQYIKAIDAARENLALYQKLMLDGNITGNLGGDEYISTGDPALVELRPTLNVTHFNEVVVDVTEFACLIDDTGVLDSEDFKFAASFYAAASDKTGQVTVDQVVYLNSIMRLNVKNNTNVTYVNYSAVAYNRSAEFSINVSVLQPTDDTLNTWRVTRVSLVDPEGNGNVNVFRYMSQVGIEEPELLYEDKIAGFVQNADDCLRVIAYIHTFQIPAITGVDVLTPDE